MDAISPNPVQRCPLATVAVTVGAVPASTTQIGKQTVMILITLLKAP
jgi:hypothetical protein